MNTATAATPDIGRTAAVLQPLVISAPPHIRRRTTVRHLMLWVMVALLPAVAVAVIMSGPRAVYSILLSIAAASAAEWLVTLYSTRKLSIPDGSAALTGLILALSLPPVMILPLWTAPVGSVFAIALVKMAFGGLGRNFLNPAMAGRAFLVAAFPALFSAAAAASASASGGTAVLPAGTLEMQNALLNFLTGYQGGWMGSTSAGALLLGAIILLCLRVIDFTIPVSFIGSSFLLLWLTGGTSSFFSAEALLTPLFQFLYSGILFGAFFLATDPVTSPAAAKARILFGIGCGGFTFLFQKFGTSSDSIMWALLLMNCAVPYMDRYLMHRTFNAKKKINGPGKIIAGPQKTEPAAETARTEMKTQQPDTVR